MKKTNFGLNDGHFTKVSTSLAQEIGHFSIPSFWKRGKRIAYLVVKKNQKKHPNIFAKNDWLRMRRRVREGL